MSIHITADEARDLMRQAVEEKGADYVYPSPGSHCRYFESDGAPSCIVGHVLAYKGATLEYLAALAGDDDANITGIYDLADGGVVDVDESTLEALGEAQDAQDGGDTWGEALGAFERRLERREEGRA